MTRRAAVTGGTGFLGTHLIRLLAEAGWQIRMLARRWPRPQAGAMPVDLVPGGLRDAEALARLVQGADAVFHLAGAVAATNRAGFFAANASGAQAVAQAWRDHAPQAHFVLVSSLAARLPEVSHYAASKAAGEQAVADLAPDRARLTILRPGAIYGPGDRATLPLFRAAAWPVQPMLAAPNARVAVLHVTDAARAVLAAAEPALPPGRYELADDRTEGHAWADLLAAVRAAAGRGAPRAVRVPTPVLRLLGAAGGAWSGMSGQPVMLTGQKVREILQPDWGSHPRAQPPDPAWRPKIELKPGFAETHAWYRQAGWL
ncbi:MAG: NAD-dependent epimerase/dehydratase family protein [Pseudomonadota bacterium]